MDGKTIRTSRFVQSQTVTVSNPMGMDAIQMAMAERPSEQNNGQWVRVLAVFFC